MKINLSQYQNFFLYVYFFSLNFESLNIGGVFSISKFAGILYLISILPNFREFFIIDKKILFYLKPLFIFLLILFVNSLLHINNFSSKIFDFATTVNILLFIAIINHARKNYLILDKVIIVYMIGTFLLSTLSYFEFGTSTSPEGRTVIFGSNANALGITISTSIMILIATVFFNSFELKKKRFFLLFFLPVLLISLIGTASRSAILVILLSLIFLFYTRIAQNKNKISSFLSSFLVMAIILIPFTYLIFQSEEFMTRILITADPESNLRLGGRLVLWDGFISIISSAPFFGYGYSGSIYETFKYFGGVHSPHNVFLEVLLYTGIFGFLFFIFFIARIFYKSFLICKYQKIILPVFLIPPILVYILGNQALPIKLVWALLAYLVGTILFYPTKNYNQ